MRALRVALMPAGHVAIASVVVAALVFDWPRPPVLQLSPLVMLLTLTALEWVAGRWHPRWRNAPRDVFFFVLTAVLGAAAPAVVLGLMPATGGLLGGLPLLLAFALAVIASDFVGYWVHRGFHGVPFLWRVHATHHAPRELYVLMAAVDGPLVVICIRGLRAAGVAALGFSADVVFAMAIFDAWQGLSAHLGVDTDNRWLARVVTTPQTHRLHHSNRMVDAGNYGVLLTLWDRVFGTWVAPGVETPALGLSAPEEFPEAWWNILLLRRPKPALTSPQLGPRPASSAVRRAGER